MYSLPQILTASVIGGVAVLLACLFSRWNILHAIIAGFMAIATTAVWRVGANIAELNSDLVPHVSIGDAGCLIAGALPALLMAFLLDDTRRWWVPGAVGGVAAFLGNVLLLW